MKLIGLNVGNRECRSRDMLSTERVHERRWIFLITDHLIETH